MKPFRPLAHRLREAFEGFVRENAEPGATVYTDEVASYRGLARDYSHEAVDHGVGEYVRGEAHTQGVESLWAMVKRGQRGVYHKFSPKRLDRHVAEFAGRHNIREADTLDQMAALTFGMAGKRLRCADLTADNGLSSGARS